MSETLDPGTTTPQPEEKTGPKRRPLRKRIVRFFLWTTGIFLFLLGGLVLLTWIYQDDVKAYVVDEVNTRVNTTIIIDPKNIDITIIKSFPDVSVEFRQITALDATASAKRDTLFTAGKIALGFNILDLFHENYTIHHITVEDAELDMRVDKKGNDNFHFLKEDSVSAGVNDTGHVVFALDKITLTNVSCSYEDRKEKTKYAADFSSLVFSGDFGAEKYDFTTDAEFTVKDLRYGKNSYFSGNKGSLQLAMSIDNSSRSYQLTQGKLKLSDFAAGISGSISERGKNYLLDLVMKGEDIDIGSALSLLPEAYHEEIADYESSGEFYLDGTVKGLYGDTATPVVKADFGVRSGGSLRHKDAQVSLNDIAMQGSFSNEKGKEGLQINSFSAHSAKSRFSGSFRQTGLDKPFYETKLTGDIDLAELRQILQPDTISAMSGKVSLSLEVSGKPAKEEPSASDFRAFKTNGKLELHEVSIELKQSKAPVDSINGELSFDGNNVSISGFTMRQGGSDLLINGTIKNLLGYIFTDNEVLDIGGSLASRRLDLNSVLATGSGTGSDTNYLVSLPERMRLKLSASVKQLNFRRFEAKSISGNIEMQKQRLVADPISFQAMEGSISGNGMLDVSENDSLLITCHADIRNVDINKLFWQMENFGQDTDVVISDKNIRGRLISQVNFASVWGKDLSVNEKKIYTDADITIEKGELIDFKPLYELSRFIKLDELKDVKFQRLSNHIEIRNRVIDIPKMEINSSAANIKLTAKHDFDNIVEYHFIVDLDDLHARKAMSAKKENSEYGEEINDGVRRKRLFIVMKGPIDNPDIDYDGKANVQQWKEDLKQEKQDLKQILHDEFGWFKGKKEGDRKDRKKEEDTDKFILLQDEDTAPPPPKEKKKKAQQEETFDDSDDY